ncbi:MAG TPA: ATP-binding protein [Polyangia bacterium]|nr:ATP-binding protein [Polyangia bacterium]
MLALLRAWRSETLWLRLALASLGTAVAVGVVCGVGLYSLEHASAAGNRAVTRQLTLIDETAAMSAFQYQKGLVAEYLVTGDPTRLAELDASRPAFEAWLARSREVIGGSAVDDLLRELQRQYRDYDRTRRLAVDLYQRGDLEQAKAALRSNDSRARDLWSGFRQFGTLARLDAEKSLAAAKQKVERLGRILVGTSIAGAIASLLLGFLWARKVTKPLYELGVRVESVAERTRIKISAGRAGLDTLGEQVAALVEKLEETDAALAEHRRRLVQSEKLSAIGELSAKLAHEVLNPMAGIKAAIQLLARQTVAAPGADSTLQVCESVNREISRVEGLMRRLMSFAKPLSPKVEVVSIEDLVDSAVAATEPVLRGFKTVVERRCDSDLPPLEVDAGLMTQVLVNLITNAAQAMAPAGGAIEIHARRAIVLGRDEVAIQVADRGPGIPDAVLSDLFKPFFTTKRDGNGLGLAVSQNIVLEHGGKIVGANRARGEGSGAVFEVQLPLLR